MNRPLHTFAVFGTRPEAIKMAPLLHAFRQDNAFALTVCVTGQHREMLDQVLDLFEIRPDYDLALMTAGQNLDTLTARVVTGVGDVLEATRPDLVVVQGDTTTCFGAALAAFYRRIPVAHVEAGLRTWQRYAPFPEELNRVLTSRLASYHFAPTAQARDNLLQEGVAGDHIWVTGNTVVDALLAIRSRLATLAPDALAPWLRTAQVDLPAVDRPIVLITGHRRENFGQGFQGICRAIARLAQTHPDWLFVYPVHLNPNVQAPVYATLGDLPNVVLMPPLPYLPFIYLMHRAYLILTDSGGIQEEALSLGKPLLVMRETTERMEAVAAGYARLVGTDTDRIVAAAEELIADPTAYARMVCTANPFGDGQAARRITAVLKREFPWAAPVEAKPQ